MQSPAAAQRWRRWLMKYRLRRCPMPRLPPFHRFPCRLHPCIAVSSSALASTTTAFIAPTTTTTAPTTAGKPRMVYTLRPTHRFHSFPTNTSRPGSRSSAWAPLPSAENNYSPEAVAPDKRGCNSGPGRRRTCFRRRRRAGGGNERTWMKDGIGDSVQQPFLQLQPVLRMTKVSPR